MHLIMLGLFYGVYIMEIINSSIIVTTRPGILANFSRISKINKILFSLRKIEELQAFHLSLTDIIQVD